MLTLHPVTGRLLTFTTAVETQWNIDRTYVVDGELTPFYSAWCFHSHWSFWIFFFKKNVNSGKHRNRKYVNRSGCNESLDMFMCAEVEMSPLWDSVRLDLRPWLEELAGGNGWQGDQTWCCVGEATTCVKEGNTAAVLAWVARGDWVGTLEVQVSGSGRATGWSHRGRSCQFPPADATHRLRQVWRQM